MDAEEVFQKYYDEVIPIVCEDYHKFIDIASSTVPYYVSSVCDLGIGTGNLSKSIKEKNPLVEIYGIDFNDNFLSQVNEKIPDAKLYTANILEGNFPKADYNVSSLTTHHFEGDFLDDFLESLVKNVRGFVNYDIFLFDGRSLDEAIQVSLDHAEKVAKNHYLFKGQDLSPLIFGMENEMRTNDKPMRLSDAESFFRDKGLEFKVIHKNFPYAVYHAFWPKKRLQ